jgi:hypothetical protein
VLEITMTGQARLASVTWQLHPDDHDKVNGQNTGLRITETAQHVICEIGIGFCCVCSYQRTTEYAEEAAYQLDVDRAIERAVERDD